MANTAAAETPTALPGGLTPLLKPSELAVYYNVSPWTVNQWVKNGCPTKRLPSGDRRFDRAAVEEWLDQEAAGAEDRAAAKSRVGLAARSA